MTDARSVMLDRIRRALGPAAEAPEVPRDYIAPLPLNPVDLFSERAAEYRATVRRVRPVELADMLGAVCGEHSARVVAAVPEFTAIDGTQVVRDDQPLTNEELDALDGVITGCACAIATTGTIVLDAGASSGRRALTLIPDLHICVVRAEQVVGDVPAAIAAIRGAVEAGRPITFISGPSATSDIELERIEGVHGPRRLEVLVVGG